MEMETDAYIKEEILETTKSSMDDEPELWEGKTVSLHCPKFGVFQGIIKFISSNQLTIARVFLDGIPLKVPEAEVSLYAADIEKIEIVPVDKELFYDTDITDSDAIVDYNSSPCLKEITRTHILKSSLANESENSSPQQSSSDNGKMANTDQDSSDTYSPPLEGNVAAFFNMIPLRVEERLAKISINPKKEKQQPPQQHQQQKQQLEKHKSKITTVNKYDSVPMGYLPGYNGRTNGSKHANVRKQTRQNSQTFGAAADDPMLNEEFDFESNLALFDKQAVWYDIEQSKNVDSFQQRKRNNGYAAVPEQKYRHDENILESSPVSKHQMECKFPSVYNYVTDDDQIIPTIPLLVRNKIENTAQKNGLTIPRQIDMLARGVCEIAILLLGGARRLTLSNYHQWPKIVIICDKSKHFRSTITGATTGRQLASQRLNVFLYTEEKPSSHQNISEIELFQATGNTVHYALDELPTPDFVILSTQLNKTPLKVTKWLNECRASIMAIDPAPGGIVEVNIKYSILPILPVTGITPENCGKLFLCNIGIPDKYYHDAGIKYKSPFGHKFVIPLHVKD